MSLVLLVEDEPALRLSLGRHLQRHEYELTEAATCLAAESSFRGRRPDVVVADYQLPDGNGLELLTRLRTIDRNVPVVMLTGFGTIDLAVRAIKQGAEQFLSKPVDVPALLAIVERICGMGRSRQADLAPEQRGARGALDPFIGQSAAVRALREQAMRLAEADGPVLVLGETGSGKGVLTRWLHEHGRRREQRLVDLNCAGLSRELLENELFGHERGAFTGAQAAKPGLLEIAHDGTLFLDEIGDIDLQVQPRLLKVLEEKRFRRLGDVKDRTVDVRLVAATHHDLAACVRENRFRSDLFYRISVLPLRIPPLRERLEDVPALARALLAREVEISPGAEKALQDYPWPGNIRELRNVLERAQVFSGKRIIEAADLHLERHQGEPAEDALTLESIERRHIERIFIREKGKVARTAQALGISRSTLYHRLERYGIAIPESGN
ncbi:MAG: sigma-54-dependent transcriptional regulator [Myxococcales bacterium]